jgi:hypothetical protein
MLPEVLHRARNGGYRGACDASLLAATLRTREVLIEDAYMSLPAGLELAEPEDLLPPAIGRQSSCHRLLVLYGTMILLALDPTMEIGLEVQVGQGKTSLRADLVGWDRYGLPISVEAGATDGRSVLAQLEAGHSRVIVLPFAGLHYGAIRGYGFRLQGTSPMPFFRAADAVRALVILRGQGAALRLAA